MCPDFDVTYTEQAIFPSAERIIFNGILNYFVLLKTLKLSKHGSFKLKGRKKEAG